VGKPKGESRGLEFLQRVRPKAIENLLSFFAESARHLDPKTRFLISVVTKVISGSERGIQQYVRRALSSGAQPAEVIDAVLCAYPCAGLTKVVDAIDVILDLGIEELEMPPAAGEEAPPSPASPEPPPAENQGPPPASPRVAEAPPAPARAAAAAPATAESVTWVAAGKVADIPPICGRRVIAGEQDIAVFTVNGELMAVENRCPHKGGSLSEGVTAEGIVTCPLHNWKFNLRTGQCPERPRVFIRTYPVRREGDQIFVGI
jgi:NAD(P)H-dependent nitrite reductase small subunit